MSTLGYQYRQRLREFLEQGSFSSDPTRERLIRRYLDAWDEWAEKAAHQMKILRLGHKWLWAGIVPGLCIFFYAVFFLEKGVNDAFKKLEREQEEFLNYRRKHGASSVENEAISYVMSEAEGV